MSGAQEKVNILLIVADSGKEAVGRLPPFLAPPHRCNLCTVVHLCNLVHNRALCIWHTVVIFAQFCTLCTFVLLAPCAQLCICRFVCTNVLFPPCAQLYIYTILYLLCTYNVLFTHTLYCKMHFQCKPHDKACIRCCPFVDVDKTVL